MRQDGCWIQACYIFLQATRNTPQESSTSANKRSIQGQHRLAVYHEVGSTSDRLILVSMELWILKEPSTHNTVIKQFAAHEGNPMRFAFF